MKLLSLLTLSTLLSISACSHFKPDCCKKDARPNCCKEQKECCKKKEACCKEKKSCDKKDAEACHKKDEQKKQ